MKNEPQFRLAEEADAETLLRFMTEYYAFDGHDFDGLKAQVALRALLRHANLGRAWLILDGGGPVGYVVLCFGYSLEWLGRDAYVDEFYLQEEYRGRGWGRRTMEFVEEAARAAEVRTLHLKSCGRTLRRCRFTRSWGAWSTTARSCRNGLAGFFQAAGEKRALKDNKA
jgi:diamine N-acetyltransferase